MNKKLLWELLIEQIPSERKTTFEEFCDRLLGTQDTLEGFAKDQLKKNNPSLYAELSSAKMLSLFDWEGYVEKLKISYHILEDAPDTYDLYLKKKQR